MVEDCPRPRRSCLAGCGLSRLGRVLPDHGRPEHHVGNQLGRLLERGNDRGNVLRGSHVPAVRSLRRCGRVRLPTRVRTRRSRVVRYEPCERRPPNDGLRGTLPLQCGLRHDRNRLRRRRVRLCPLRARCRKWNSQLCLRHGKPAGQRKLHCIFTQWPIARILRWRWNGSSRLRAERAVPVAAFGDLPARVWLRTSGFRRGPLLPGLRRRGGLLPPGLHM